MTTASKEKAKYEKMWRHPSYRQHSPGEALVPLFLERIPWEKGQTAIDLGCGTGRAGYALQKAGLKVALFDLTRSALDEMFWRDGFKGFPELGFTEGCLWEPDAFAPLEGCPFQFGPYDWIFCADVLEHIPTEHIDATLDNMAGVTGQGGMLQIALGQDSCGKLIGDTLHLTVQPASWWESKVRGRWDIRESMTVENDWRVIFFIGQPKKKPQERAL